MLPIFNALRPRVSDSDRIAPRDRPIRFSSPERGL
jgi:hypothetical protein